MGRDLQKRKRRSSRPTIRQPNRLKKPLNPRGNDLVAKNWNKKQTMTQNYRRLGLVAKLGKATGGAEKRPHEDKSAPPAQDPLAVTPDSGARGAIQSVKVERDAGGRIVRVVARDNPLNDPLNALDSDSEDDNNNNDNDADGGDGDEWGGITEEKTGRETTVADLLEKEAARPVEKPIRHQSAREREWLQSLVDKHGDDTAAMARDAKLNPMQQTARDIARRLKTYKPSSES